MTELIRDFCYTYAGDITAIHADAIVNAANSGLLGGGGVDGAIHRAAGPSLLAACRQLRESTYKEGLPVGEAVATTAGRLHASYVIHTVGPVWIDGNHNEPVLLRAAYNNSLAVAQDLGCTSIAFPAISTGVYHYPKDRAAHIVLDALIAYRESVPAAVRMKIYLVFFTNRDEELFHHAISRRKDELCH